MAETVIDADTHVRESDATWDYLDPGKFPQRPVRLAAGEKKVRFWTINGRVFPKPVGKGALLAGEEGAERNVKLDMSAGAAELTDVESRVRDMNEREIGVQVIYPTMFLSWMTDEVDLEVALCKSYNRFMADACGKAPERLRWGVVLPLRSIEDSLSEMGWAKDRGAVAIFVRGLEGDRTLDDPYFFPVYEEAMKLDLVLGVHVGRGSPAMAEIFDAARNSNFGHTRILPVLAFRDIVWNGIPEKFPRLRFAFLEACSQWVPYVLHEINRRRVTFGRNPLNGPNLFRENRLYVACEVDEDLPWVMKYTGEDNIVIGSDYGHTDASYVRDLVSRLRSREDLPTEVKEKILAKNAKRLYGL
jgi:predicted TIM-barrel fold metal-dependent hydrolase